MREIDTLQQKVSNQEKEECQAADDVKELRNMLDQEKKKLERQIAVTQTDRVFISYYLCFLCSL